MDGGPSHTSPIPEFCTGQVNLSQVSNQQEGQGEGSSRASSGLELKGLLESKDNVGPKHAKTQPPALKELTV